MKLAAATLLGMSKEVKNHFAQRGWLANLADRTYTPLYDRAPVIARTKRSPVAPGAIPEDPFSWSYNRKTKRYLSEMKRTRLPKGKRRSLFEKWLDQMKGYRWGNIRAYVASEDPMWNFFFNRYKEPWTPEKVRFLRLLYRHTKNPNGLDELFWFLADLTEEEEPEMLQAVESPIEDILNECPLPLVVPAEDIFEIDFQEYGWVQVRTLTNDLALVNFRFLDDQISAPNGIPLGIASQKDIYRSTAIVLGFTTHIHGIDRFCEGYDIYEDESITFWDDISSKAPWHEVVRMVQCCRNQYSMNEILAMSEEELLESCCKKDEDEDEDEEAWSLEEFKEALNAAFPGLVEPMSLPYENREEPEEGDRVSTVSSQTTKNDPDAEPDKHLKR